MLSLQKMVAGFVIIAAVASSIFASSQIIIPRFRQLKHNVISMTTKIDFYSKFISRYLI